MALVAAAATVCHGSAYLLVFGSASPGLISIPHLRVTLPRSRRAGTVCGSLSFVLQACGSWLQSGRLSVMSIPSHGMRWSLLSVFPFPTFLIMYVHGFWISGKMSSLLLSYLCYFTSPQQTCGHDLCASGAFEKTASSRCREKTSILTSCGWPELQVRGNERGFTMCAESVLIRYRHWKASPPIEPHRKCPPALPYLGQSRS